MTSTVTAHFQTSYGTVQDSFLETVHTVLCQLVNLLFLQKNLDFIAVLRIHDILVWIRILGSMPLTNGSGCGSGSFDVHH